MPYIIVYIADTPKFWNMSAASHHYSYEHKLAEYEERKEQTCKAEGISEYKLVTL